MFFSFSAESRPEDMYWILNLVETDPDLYVRYLNISTVIDVIKVGLLNIQ